MFSNYKRDLSLFLFFLSLVGLTLFYGCGAGDTKVDSLPETLYMVSGRVEVEDGIIASTGLDLSPSVKVWLEDGTVAKRSVNPNGAFSIGNLTPGKQYVVVAEYTDLAGKIYKTRMKGVAQLTENNPQVEVAPIKITRKDECTAYVEGVLKNESGIPVTNQTVSLWGEKVLTDDNGHFTTPLMPKNTDGGWEVYVPARNGFQQTAFSLKFEEKPQTIELALATIDSPNRGPIVTLDCDRRESRPGGTMRLTATAQDPDGIEDLQDLSKEIQYTWSATSGVFQINGEEKSSPLVTTNRNVVWQAPSTLYSEATQTVSVSVKDKGGLVAKASVGINVTASPAQQNNPPYIIYDLCEIPASMYANEFYKFKFVGADSDWNSSNDTGKFLKYYVKVFDENNNQVGRFYEKNEAESKYDNANITGGFTQTQLGEECVLYWRWPLNADSDTSMFPQNVRIQVDVYDEFTKDYTKPNNPQTFDSVVADEMPNTPPYVVQYQVDGTAKTLLAPLLPFAGVDTSMTLRSNTEVEVKITTADASPYDLISQKWLTQQELDAMAKNHPLFSYIDPDAKVNLRLQEPMSTDTIKFTVGAWQQDTKGDAYLGLELKDNRGAVQTYVFLFKVEKNPGLDPRMYPVMNILKPVELAENPGSMPIYKIGSELTFGGEGSYWDPVQRRRVGVLPKNFEWRLERFNSEDVWEVFPAKMPDESETVSGDEFTQKFEYSGRYRISLKGYSNLGYYNTPLVQEEFFINSEPVVALAEFNPVSFLDSPKYFYLGESPSVRVIITDVDQNLALPSGEPWVPEDLKAALEIKYGNRKETRQILSGSHPYIVNIPLDMDGAAPEEALNPGKYTFEITVYDALGDASELGKLDFEILAHPTATMVSPAEGSRAVIDKPFAAAINVTGVPEELMAELDTHIEWRLNGTLLTHKAKSFAYDKAQNVPGIQRGENTLVASFAYNGTDEIVSTVNFIYNDGPKNAVVQMTPPNNASIYVTTEIIFEVDANQLSFATDALKNTAKYSWKDVTASDPDHQFSLGTLPRQKYTYAKEHAGHRTVRFTVEDDDGLKATKDISFDIHITHAPPVFTMANIESPANNAFFNAGAGVIFKLYTDADKLPEFAFAHHMQTATWEFKDVTAQLMQDQFVVANGNFQGVPATNDLAKVYMGYGSDKLGTRKIKATVNDNDPVQAESTSVQFDIHINVDPTIKLNGMSSAGVPMTSAPGTRFDHNTAITFHYTAADADPNDKLTVRLKNADTAHVYGSSAPLVTADHTGRLVINPFPAGPAKVVMEVVDSRNVIVQSSETLELLVNSLPVVNEPTISVSSLGGVLRPTVADHPQIFISPGAQAILDFNATALNGVGQNLNGNQLFWKFGALSKPGNSITATLAPGKYNIGINAYDNILAASEGWPVNPSSDVSETDYRNAALQPYNDQETPNMLKSKSSYATKAFYVMSMAKDASAGMTGAKLLHVEGQHVYIANNREIKVFTLQGNNLTPVTTKFKTCDIGTTNGNIIGLAHYSSGVPVVLTDANRLVHFYDDSATPDVAVAQVTSLGGTYSFLQKRGNYLLVFASNGSAVEYGPDAVANPEKQPMVLRNTYPAPQVDGMSATFNSFDVYESSGSILDGIYGITSTNRILRFNTDDMTHQVFLADSTAPAGASSVALIDGTKIFAANGSNVAMFDNSPSNPMTARRIFASALPGVSTIIDMKTVGQGRIMLLTNANGTVHFLDIGANTWPEYNSVSDMIWEKK